MANIANFLQSVLGGAPSQPAGTMFGAPGQANNGIMPVQQADIVRQAPMQAPNVPQVQAPPARQRRSLIETIGGISDVLARVGGAEALYQPSIDARQDRVTGAEDRMRQIDLDELKMRQGEQQIESGDMEMETAQKAIAANALRGLKAIQKSGGDVARAWPILAQQAGLDEESTAQFAQIFSQDPRSIDGLITTLGGSPAEFGLQPFYAQDGEGNLKAYQLGKDGAVQEVRLGEGESPVDPLKFVDLGGSQAGVGSRSGRVTRILPKTEAPGKSEDRASRERIARGNNDTRITVAGMKPGPKGKADTGKAGPAQIETAMANIDELDKIYDDLNDMGAMVNTENSKGGNVGAYIRSSGAGQIVEGALGTEAQSKRDRVNSLRPALMQSIAQATGLSSKQLDSNAELKLYMQTVTNPTASYSANKAAIAGLRRFIDANAKAAQPAPSNRPAARNVKPAGKKPAAKSPPKPTVSNW